MPEIVPVDLELHMIVHMDELMHDCILHMILVQELALAEYDCASFGAESARPVNVTRRADNVIAGDIAAIQLEVFHHEDHSRACERHRGRQSVSRNR